jgi:hypothetical protein
MVSSNQNCKKGDLPVSLPPTVPRSSMDRDFIFDDYKTVIENTAKLSDRRQTINDIFVGLNSLFLTALGFLFVSLQLTSWWPTIVFAFVSAATTVINTTWMRINNRYRELIRVRLAYAQAREMQLQEQFQAPTVRVIIDPHKKTKKDETMFGVLQWEERTLYPPDDSPHIKANFSQLEQQLIRFFLVSYFVLTAIVALLTYLIDYLHLTAFIIKA